MKKKPRILRIIVGICAIFGLCMVMNTSLKAQDEPKKVFGKGQPFTVNELPAGKLKDELKQLSPQARGKAMKWLKTFTFGAGDAAHHLRADNQGGIFYTCPGTNENCDDHSCKHPEHKEKPDLTEEAVIDAVETSSAESTDSPTTAAASVPISSPPAYNSKSDALHHIYLDFNGGVVADTAWNNSKKIGSWNCLAWSQDSDRTTFNDSEKADIRRIWERVAEDYAPYNVNVTTDVIYDPDNYTGDKNKVGWLMITPTTDNDGVQCPHYGYGGIAYVNVYGNSNYTYYSPAWVTDMSASSISEAANHEMGHNLGLSHDNTSTKNYYTGHAGTPTAPSWGPIMGTSYGRNVTQWSKGEYYDANQNQDDLAIIANRIPYRSPDHGNSFSTATILNSNTINQAGIIEKTGMADYFTFTVGSSSTLSLDAKAFRTDASTWGANLDIKLELYNSSQQPISSSNPAAELDAAISANVTQGTYYLVVRPTGAGSPLTSSPSGYTAYGSLGKYTITGNITSSNTVPIANAGVDQTVTDTDNSGSESVTLNGSGSSDPDGTITSYVWKNGTTQIATGVNPSVVLDVGTHTITLTVTDNVGATATDTVVVTVNQAPVANAGVDMTVTDTDGNGSQSVTLNGSGSSDPDGTIASYVWKKGTTQIATGESPSVVLDVGTHTITLTVTDNRGAIGTDTVVVTVKNSSIVLRTPENPASTQPGIKWERFLGNWSMLPNFSTLTAAAQGTSSVIGLGMGEPADYYAYRFTGYIQVPVDGTYTFYTSSDDGSKLYIGTTLVVNNDGVHALREMSGSIGLKAGKHAITIAFFERAGGNVLDAFWQGPGLAKQEIPASALHNTSNSANTNLQAHFKFDETSGTTAADASGKGNVGTLVNGPEWTSSGALGGALLFDGINDYVNVPDAPGLRLGKAQTLEARIKLDALKSNWIRVIGKGATATRNYGMWIQPNTGRILYQIYSAGGQGNVTSSAALPLGQWAHVACVYDGATMKIYINGALNAQLAYTQTPYTSADPLTIGYGNISTYHKGGIDEAKVHNKALTASEVLASYEGTASGAEEQLAASEGLAVASSINTIRSNQLKLPVKGADKASLTISENKTGYKVGTLLTRNELHMAYIENPWGIRLELGTLGGENSYAFSINDQRTVYGASQKADGTYHAFKYANDEMLDVGALGNVEDWNLAQGVDAAGANLVGTSQDADGIKKLVVFGNAEIIHHIAPTGWCIESNRELKAVLWDEAVAPE